MSTDELVKVMRDNHKIIKIELDSKVTDAQSFWNDLSHDMFMSFDSPLDSDIRESMTSFRDVDSLEMVNKSGRLLKRFAKHFKETQGYKLDDKTLGVMGDKLQYYISQEAKVYYVDFTDSINWEDGQFGKSHSCWWGTYSESVPSYENAGGWGIRFYNDENQDNDNGIGRTWVFPKDGMLMCFNSYGIERPNVSKVIKEVYKQSGIILHYKTVELYNGQNDEIPYINSGTGFVLFPEEIDPESLDDRYDLDIEAERDDRDVCYDCGCRIDDGDGYYVNDETYCESCCNDRFAFCERCDEYCDRDEVHEITGSRRYSYICQYCAESIGAALCEKCDTYSEDYIITEDTSETYCEDCASNEAYYCESCEEWNSEEHNHEEDESEEEESSSEIIPDDDIEKDFISVELETITTRIGSYYNPDSKEHTTMVYRHSLIPGLYVWQADNDLWNIVHESSGLMAWNSTSLHLALEGLSRLQGLHDWTLPKETITDNRDLCNTILEIRRQLS